MKQKFERNLLSGVYTFATEAKAPCPGYFNTQRGWVNYLIGDAISFSHRKNNYDDYHYPYALEMHDYYELILYHSGEELQYIADGQYFIVPPSSALLIKPYTMHMLRLPSPIPCERYVINFRSVDELFPDRSVLAFLEKGSANCALFPAECYRFSSLAAAVDAELRAKVTPFQNARALMRITELFLALSESRPADGIGRDELSDLSSVPAFILEVKEYIDQHFLHISSVTELTDHFFYNRDYLSKTFRRYFNIPIYDYILSRKLMHGRSLLLSGKSVAQAMQESGFHNRASFTKLFRKQFDCAPSSVKPRSDHSCVIK